MNTRDTYKDSKTVPLVGRVVPAKPELARPRANKLIDTTEYKCTQK
jgi:hypothetical protein